MSEITHISEILPGILAQVIKASERSGGMQYPYYRQLEERDVPQEIAESWFQHHAKKGIPVAMTVGIDPMKKDKNRRTYQVWVAGDDMVSSNPNTEEIFGTIIKEANGFDALCRFDAGEAANG